VQGVGASQQRGYHQELASHLPLAQCWE